MGKEDERKECMQERREILRGKKDGKKGEKRRGGEIKKVKGKKSREGG